MKKPLAGFGTWRTHAQTDSGNVTVVENTEGLKPEQAGTVSVNPCTAWRKLKDFREVKEEEWFVQNGADLGVGWTAIHLGRRRGMKSIKVVRKWESGHEELVKELERLGADIVVTEE